MMEALLQYAEVGDRKKVEQVASSLSEEMPLGDEDSLPPADRLLALAKSGPSTLTWSGLSRPEDVVGHNPRRNVRLG